MYDDAARRAEDGADIDDPVLGHPMLYTSGTTGRPKGVHRASAPPSRRSPRSTSFGYDGPSERDAHLCTGPLYHAAPLAFSLAVPLALRRRRRGHGPLGRRGDAAPDREHTGHPHPHGADDVPPPARRCPTTCAARYDISSLRFVIHGAAPCPVPVKQRLIEWLGPGRGRVLRRHRGLGTFVDSHDLAEAPGHGRQARWCRIWSRSPTRTATSCAAGEIGLVFLQRPGRHGRFDYYGDPDKTAGAFRGDYFTLGDMGYLDDDGYLFLTDRTANLIISGGVNIYPAEVDAVLLEHPGRRRRRHHRRARRRVGRSGARRSSSWPRASRRQPSAGRRADRASAATAWPTSSARAPSTSSTSCPATTTASSTAASSATDTSTEVHLRISAATRSRRRGRHSLRQTSWRVRRRAPAAPSSLTAPLGGTGRWLPDLPDGQTTLPAGATCSGFQVGLPLIAQ